MQPALRILATAMIGAIAISVSPARGADVVTVQSATDASGSREAYPMAVLKLVLEKSEPEFGPFHIDVDQLDMRQGRRVQQLARGLGPLNLLWTGTSPEREAMLTPIRYPLYRGLLGWRIFIIRQDRQSRFDRIAGIGGLRALTACQGADWPDSDILEAAGFTVRRITSYEPQFHLVANGRCDYFPRALVEPFAELAARPELPSLGVEQQWMLRYPLVLYFFLRPDEERLRRRLVSGFERAYADGDMLRLFYGHPLIRDALANAEIDQRTTFALDNPLAPAKTPVDRPILWFNVEEWARWTARLDAETADQ